MPPPPPPSGCPTRGVFAGRACAQRRLPPAARGAGEVRERRPRPAPRRARGPSRGARHGGHRHRPLPLPPPAPSPAGGAGGAGRGARARGRPPPFPALWLACSLPPSQLRWVTALAPRAPAAGAAAPLSWAPGPRLSAGSNAGPGRTNGPACVRPCAPSETRAEPPPPPRPATTTRSPPPAAPPPALSPLPPRPSAQARPPAREPIGCRRRARVSPRRAHPHWPPRGNVSHMQIRAGRGRLRLASSRPGRDRGRREAGRAHCSKGAEPGGRRFRAPRCGGPGVVCSAVCPVRARNTLTRGSARVGDQGPAGQTNCT